MQQPIGPKPGVGFSNDADALSKLPFRRPSEPLATIADPGGGNASVSPPDQTSSFPCRAYASAVS